MPKISFIKNRAGFDVQAGENLMKALLAHGIPVASSCNGDGVCGKCRLQIVKGSKNLSDRNATENFLTEKNNAEDDIRFSCQAFVHGDITIDATYW